LHINMMNMGYGLAFPSYREVEECADYGVMYGHPTDQILDIQQAKDNNKMFYTFKSEDLIDDRFHYVIMQFNPFHPMAYKYVKNLRVDGKQYVGDYTFNGDQFKFQYDLDDKRWRVHPDVWIPSLNVQDQRYEMFDLVGNHDFLLNFSRIDDSKVISPLLVEPFITNRIASRGYSVIGPWLGELYQGVADVTYSPAYTKSVRHDFPARKYREITDNVICYPDKYEVGHSCSVKKIGANKKKRKCGCVKSDVKIYDYYMDTGIFVRYNRIKGRHRAFVQDDEGKFDFLEVPYQVLSYPKSGNRSIVYPYHAVTVLALMSDPFSSLRQSLPLDIPIYRQGLEIEVCQEDDMDIELEYVSWSCKVMKDKFAAFNIAIEEIGAVGEYHEEEKYYTIVCRFVHGYEPCLTSYIVSKEEIIDLNIYEMFKKVDKCKYYQE